MFCINFLNCERPSLQDISFSMYLQGASPRQPTNSEITAYVILLLLYSILAVAVVASVSLAFYVQCLKAKILKKSLKTTERTQSY